MDCAGVGVVLPRGPEVDIERRVGFLTPDNLLTPLMAGTGDGKEVD